MKLFLLFYIIVNKFDTVHCLVHLFLYIKLAHNQVGGRLDSRRVLVRNGWIHIGFWSGVGWILVRNRRVGWILVVIRRCLDVENLTSKKLSFST